MTREGRFGFNEDAPYLSEDKLLVCGYTLASLRTVLNSQVGADVVTHDASSWSPCVIADLASRGVFEKLQEEAKQQ